VYVAADGSVVREGVAGVIGAGAALAGALSVACAALLDGDDSRSAVGGVLHAALTAAAKYASQRSRGRWNFPAGSRIMAEEYSVPLHAFMDLFLLLLEAGVALALLLGIVWWTWPR
jgi:hypothetical protein